MTRTVGEIAYQESEFLYPNELYPEDETNAYIPELSSLTKHQGIQAKRIK
jgi:hypothetical protein